jgi:hypothetical protein
MYFHGNVTINSYDSSQGTPAATTEDSGGDVGTNGNLQIQGSVEVQGNLYTPRTGVGDCEEGAVTALTETGSAEVTGSIIQLPKPVEFPLPVFSETPGTNTVTIDDAASLATACADLGLTAGVDCFINAGAQSIRIDGNGSDVTLPNVVIDGGYTLIIDGNNPAQNININSLTGSGDVEINANLASDLDEAVVLKIAGKNADDTDMDVPFDLDTLSWKQNSAVQQYDASALQIVYGGPATINMKGGNSQSAATIYAPNAHFELKGTQDFYGSVLAKTVENHGNAGIHYDRSLQSKLWVSGQPMIGTFTWKRY